MAFSVSISQDRKGVLGSPPLSSIMRNARPKCANMLSFLIVSCQS
jgi:hypothetical protein